MTSHSDSRRRELEHNSVMLLHLIVADLGARKPRSVADNWSPRMTAEGRHVTVARELERTLRAAWRTLETNDRAGYRPPLSQFRASLGWLRESDHAFDLFPKAAHAKLRQARELLSQVVEAGLA